MMQNELFEKDFQQERKDREHAHSLIADKDKELMQALSENQELQQQQVSSQKQPGSKLRKAVHTQPQLSAKQVAELEEAKATAVQQVRSYKTQADGYRKDLDAERKRTWELKQELERLKTKPGSSAMGAAVEEKVSMCITI